MILGFVGAFWLFLLVFLVVIYFRVSRSFSWLEVEDAE